MPLQSEQTEKADKKINIGVITYHGSHSWKPIEKYEGKQ